MASMLFWLCLALGSVLVSSAPIYLVEANDMTFVVGCVHIDQVSIFGTTGDYEEITARAWLNQTDTSGHILEFNVTGLLNKADHSLFSFNGTQEGTWTAPGGHPTLTLLSISYENAPTRVGTISGGVVLGSWTLEADIEFLSLTEPALGFLIRKGTNATWGGLPDAPQDYGSLEPLTDAGYVISTFDGQFSFASGVTVPVHEGNNLFADSMFHGVAVHWTGTCQFAGGFQCTVTGDVANFNLGADLEVENTQVVVQFPTAPTLSMETDLTWTSLRSFHLTGEISSSDVHFTGTSSSEWPIALGGSSSPVVTDIDIDLSHQWSGATTAKLAGVLTWPPHFPNSLAVTMLYPADASHPHCVSLTADFTKGAPTGLTVDDIAGSSSNFSASAASPPDASGLFGTSLTELELTIYPGCGAVAVKGVADVQHGFGVVTVEAAAYNSNTAADALQTAGSGLAHDPSVDVMGVTSAPCSDVLTAVSRAFAPTNITIPKMSTVGGTAMDAAVVARDVCKSLRLPLLLNVSDFVVTVDCDYALTLVIDALNASDVALPPLPSHAVAPADSTGTWEFMASITTNNVSWPLSEPKDIWLSVPSFAVASGSFAIQMGSGESVVGEQGLNFVAQLDVGKSPWAPLSAFHAVSSAACQAQEYQASGSLGPSGWFLQAALDEGCLIVGGDKVQLSQSSLRLQPEAPQLSLATQAVLLNIQNLTLQASGDIGTAGINLNGQSTSVYQTHVGAEPLAVTGVSANLDLSLSPPSFSASLSGSIILNTTEEISVSASVDSSSLDLALSAHVHEDKPVVLGNFMDRLIGQAAVDKIPLPQSLKDKLFQILLVDAALSISTNPPSLSGSGEIEFFTKVAVSASIGFDSTGFHFGFSVQKVPSDPFKFSSLMPAFTALDGLKLQDPALAISTSEAEFTIPGIPYTMSAQQGLTFAAVFLLDPANPIEEALLHLTNAGNLTVMGAVDPAEVSFQLSAAEDAHAQISKGIELDGSSIFLNVGHAAVDVGVSATVAVNVSAHDTLTFTGKLAVGTSGVTADLALTGDWVKPFDLSGVVIHDPELSFTVSPVLVLGEFGLKGAATIGTAASAVADVYVDMADVTHSVLGLSVSVAKLLDVAAVGNVNPATVSKVAGGATLTDVMLSINPSLAPVVYENVTFPPGLDASVKLVNVGPITGSAELVIDPTRGVKVDGGVQAFTLGKYLAVNSASDNITLMIGEPAEFEVEGNVTLFGVNCFCNISLSDEGAYADIALVTDFLSAAIALSAPGDPLNPVDWAVKAKVEFTPWLSNKFPDLARDSEGKWGKKLNDTKVYVDGLQGQIDDYKQKIATRSLDDNKTKAEALKKVQEWEDAVAKAKTKVDGLQQQIDDDKAKEKKCHKWDLACKAKYEAEVKGLEAAKATADAALKVAQQGLDAAEKAASKIPGPDFDPDIIKWKAEVAVDEAAMRAADQTIEGLEKLLKVAVDTIAAGAKALAPTSSTFTAPSFAAVSAGGTGTLEAKGVFLGAAFDTTVAAKLQDSDGFSQVLWDTLSKERSQSEP